ncbi:CPBP family intramembrane glutamic endopeptidase [Bdellovibrio sp. KM01]|uniref:CPBP family intramembrane glutamic endopeptidase n=1 Tax=Bdellovibrio sp. KM01 TaxID=2748865 RepID=UPI0015EAD616|nr:CPBP family intramembrane glutamic endopeptidase [Bdellovibrio sp. KM01]QLY26938.1 CPBP family intramembrane metalloprotease [Bdellovibrio sp. KM01]
MTIKNFIYGFWLIAYTALSYFFFVEGDYKVSLYGWLGLMVLVTTVKPLREHAVFLFVVGACFAVVNLIHRFVPWLGWPLDFYLAAIVGFLILRFGFRKPTEKLKWSFSFSKAELLSILLINIPSVAILIWYYQAHPEVAEMWPKLYLPWWSLPFVVLLIAAMNGLREEIFYRGLLQPASSKNSPIWYVIGLQAVLFGFLHFAGSFPQGWLGVGMTAVWGAAIAIQYQIFKSISLSWVTHAIADAIMFSIILYVRT